MVVAEVEAKQSECVRVRSIFCAPLAFAGRASTIGPVCPGHTRASKVFCVGDIHVENFGIWRDADARHVWGLNDFYEAAVVPCAYDLIPRVRHQTRPEPDFGDPESIESIA